MPWLFLTPAEQGILLDNGLQFLKQRIVKEILDADLQPVAQLLYRDNARIFAFGSEHTVYGRGLDAALIGESVYRHAALGA